MATAFYCHKMCYFRWVINTTLSSRSHGNERPALLSIMGLIFCILYLSHKPDAFRQWNHVFTWFPLELGMHLKCSSLAHFLPLPFFLVSVERNSAYRVAVWSNLCSISAGLINTQSEQSQVIPSCVNKSQNTDTNLIHPSRVPVWIWNISCKNIKFFSFSIHCHWFP